MVWKKHEILIQQIIFTISVISKSFGRKKILLAAHLLDFYKFMNKYKELMEQRNFKNVKNYVNIKIYSYLETSGGQRSYLYLNVVHFFNTSVN